ncbi:hypothetical protein LB543_09555 [Mesorhizobium sp. ESP7-2]|uniref:hypothetical protein n=1 Tax=Mesorhizobium sp. ESP7-2 TaxID=2876622 RepID=UPI001CCA1A34|nr:hypothetical protein [Mesorhizobium sp. ESP7-2]MBZ9706964.1 hypothetical protein [Mesorhizobium sp. ESP7-2]
MSRFIVSVTERGVEEKRERLYDAWDRASSGRPGRPPRTDRLPFIMVLVDYLESTGVPFATARSSRMNKAVRNWIKDQVDTSLKKVQAPDAVSAEPEGVATAAQAASSSTFERKSDRWPLGPDAVQALLKQVKDMRNLSREKDEQ